MNVVWSLGARYCVRQDAHAFMWLWALLVTLAGAALVLRRCGRRFEAAALAVLAVCTGAIGFTIFYACYGSAPYSMGLGTPAISAGRLTTLTCLSQDVGAPVFLWTVAALACGAALGALAWARSRNRSAAVRAMLYAGAAVCILIAAGAGCIAFFAFSWCASRRLF